MTLKRWLTSSHDASSSSILLTDGGVSTHLEDLLRPMKEKFAHRSLWSSSLLLTDEGCQTIAQGHRDWLKSGSDILTTVTYQCHYSMQGQEAVVSSKEMDELLAHGVQLAKDACHGHNRESYVVASSGCFGAGLSDGSEYTGAYGSIDRQNLIEFHRRKAKVLVEQEPDGLAIETVPNIEECHTICDLFASGDLKVPPSMAVWVSLACQNGHQLNDGTELLEVLDIFRERDPDSKLIHAIGINCCDTQYIPALLKTITEDMATKGPRRGIVFYPNSGEDWDAENETWKEGTGCTASDEFVSRLMNAVHVIERTWKQHDPSSRSPKLIIGGCCRTSPRTIEELRSAVDAHSLQ